MGAVMGWTARQVEEHTAWELLSAWSGWLAANCQDPQLPPPTDEEHDALVERYG